MEKVSLGNTGLKISRLCFGTLPMGKLEANLAIEEGAQVIHYAFNHGINFVDTAQVYGTYEHIREAKKGIKQKIVIATKTSVVTEDETKRVVEEAISKLDVNYIDIFHLHAARDIEPFVKYAETLKCLFSYKVKGLIKHIGLASHVVSAIRAASDRDEIEVIHPLINQAGLGIIDGRQFVRASSVVDMESVIRIARENGKGVYAMKGLAGGNLLAEYETALRFLLSNGNIDAIAVGMVNREEVEMNINLFSGKRLTNEQRQRLKKTDKRIIILPFCKGCATCVPVCPNNALSVVDGKCQVEQAKCILCGYCGPACPQFCIRVV